jgi:coenzyme PQQ precursor peptide PqqA
MSSPALGSPRMLIGIGCGHQAGGQSRSPKAGGPKTGISSYDNRPRQQIAFMAERRAVFGRCLRSGFAPLHDPLRRSHQGEDPMAWTKPRVTEISIALEINAHACAELG